MDLIGHLEEDGSESSFMRGCFLLAFLLAVPLSGRPLCAQAPAASASSPGPRAVPASHPSPPVDFGHLPWVDGEALSYLVTWETFEAAEGTFTAKLKGDRWEFNLALASRGIVNSIYPFSGNFWSILAPAPWRSVEYGEYRFEPNRIIKERTRIDYIKNRGTREQWAEGKTKTFPIDQPGVDDIGTMLYHLRAGEWKPGDKRTIYVYENNSEKQAEAECQGRESRAFGRWPRQQLLRISVLPTVGTHHRGHLMLWITDDARRLPLHGELEFRYGTFAMDLTREVNVHPPGP